MVMILTRLPAAKTKEPQTEQLFRQYLNYSRAIEIIRIALKKEYGISWISDKEFDHFIILVKYKAGTNSIFTLTVRGTKEEIDNLQKDADIRQPFLSN